MPRIDCIAAWKYAVGPSCHQMNATAGNLHRDGYRMIPSNRRPVAGEEAPDGLEPTCSKDRKIKCNRHGGYPHKTTMLGP